MQMSGVKVSQVGRTAKRGPKMCAGLTTEKRLGQIEADGAVQRGKESHRVG